MRNIARTDWKVYKPDGEYTAATKDPEEAAALIEFLGEGAQIKYQHHTLAWTEGKEIQPAGASYDYVAKLCEFRVNESRRMARALDELSKQAKTPEQALQLCRPIAVRFEVDHAELYKHHLARRRKRAKKAARTNERLSHTLKALLNDGGKSNGQ